MSIVTVNRLDQLKAQEAELIKAAEGETASSTDDKLVDPTQSTTDASKEPSRDKSDVTTEQDAKKSDDVTDLDYWKNRALEVEFRFGKYKAKTDTTIFELRTETRTLRENILTLTERAEAAEKLSRSESTPVESLFSKDVEDILGTETVSAIRDAISKTNERVDRAEAKVKESETKQQSERIKKDELEAYESFVSSLEFFVPDVRILNKDQSFLSWLSIQDVTGTPRIQRLQAAQKIGDIERVASFFKEYKASLQPIKQEIPKNPSKDSIASRVGPVQKSSSSEVKKESTGEITVSFIRNFEADVSRGKYKGRESEKRAITEQIDRAYLEGKIVM